MAKTKDISSRILQEKLEEENETGDVLSPPPSRCPNNLGQITPIGGRKKMLNLPPFAQQPPANIIEPETENKLKTIMKRNSILNIEDVQYKTEQKDLEDLGELGNGTSGHVVKMRHKETGRIIAVKQMRSTGNSEETKRIIMDIDVVLKSHDCPYIVQCLGFITETDVWIYMELMATCFDKLLKNSNTPVPENILGKVTVATVKALSYLNDEHGVIHRNVKPSNILIDERGNIKLCDFGISGRLVDSKAKTRFAGCAAYMAPERIDPKKPEYDIRADVWSVGITLVELATGSFPYKNCKTTDEVLTRVLEADPPCLPADGKFSIDFQTFVRKCLTKNYKERPKYAELQEQPFFKDFEQMPVDVAGWFASVMDSPGIQPNCRVTSKNPPVKIVYNLLDYDEENDHTLSQSAAKKPEMQISVKSTSGQTLVIDTTSDETIASLKQKIYLKTGLPPSFQVLNYAVNILDDEKTLADYKIETLATVTLNGRVDGGSILQFRSMRIEWLCRKAINHQPNQHLKDLLIRQFSEVLKIHDQKSVNEYDMKYPNDAVM